MAEAGCDKYEYMKYLREKYIDINKLITNDKNLTFLVGKNDDERNLFPVPVLYDIDNDIYYSFKEIIIESGLGMEARADVVEGESKDVDVYFDYGIDTDIDKINKFYDYGGEFTDAVYLYDLAYYSKEAERDDEEER